MDVADPLVAKLQRSLVLSDAERAAIGAVPVTLESRRGGDGVVWAGTARRAAS